MVKKIMSDCGRELSQLTDISVSSGPGSYTGIRIGIAAVKAMSFALDIPCYAVSSLEGLAYNCGFIGYICPVMKARKDLVYTALFRTDKDKLVRCTDEKKLFQCLNWTVFLVEINESVMITGDGAEVFCDEFKKMQSMFCLLFT